MPAVGDERHAAHAPARRGLVLGDCLVAGKADQGDDERKGYVRQSWAVHQMLYRGDARGHRAGHDEAEDDKTGEVLTAVVAVGEPARGRAAAEDEGAGERNRGGDVAEVVQPVGEHRSAARQRSGGELERCDAGKHERADRHHAQRAAIVTHRDAVNMPVVSGAVARGVIVLGLMVCSVLVMRPRCVGGAMLLGHQLASVRWAASRSAASTPASWPARSGATRTASRRSLAVTSSTS